MNELFCSAKIRVVSGKVGTKIGDGRFIPSEKQMEQWLNRKLNLLER